MTLKQERLAGKESLCLNCDMPLHVDGGCYNPTCCEPELSRPDRTEPASASSELETRLRKLLGPDTVLDHHSFEIKNGNLRILLDTLATLRNDLERATALAGIDRSNHHNAALCPHCTGNGQFVMVEAAVLSRKDDECAAALALMKTMLPTNMSLDNTRWPDSTTVPLETTLGELRAIRDFIAKAEAALTTNQDTPERPTDAG